MTNTSRRIPNHVRERILTDFMFKFQRSSYTETFRPNVMVVALKEYHRMVKA